MPVSVAEIAKDLTVAAIQAQPGVIAPRTTGPGDERAVGTEVAQLFTQIYTAIKNLPGITG